jgi:hypothetical protein
VAKSDGQLSARLRRAQDRLERAVDSLDAAVEENGTRADDAARAENEEIKKKTGAVSERLDLTIGRLKAVLED